MNSITQSLLSIVSDFKGKFTGAYNIREDGECAGRQSTANIKIDSKTDGPGLIIRVLPGTQNENVYIPACVTKAGVSDLVYNDFYIGKDANVTIVAGCGVHSEGEEEASHNGIHRFFIDEGASVIYEEKHIGTGSGSGKKRIDPVTEVTLQKNAQLTMDTTQISGVDLTTRKTTATLHDGAKLLIRERLMTDGDEHADTDFDVDLIGEDCGVDLISRSVARGHSHQVYRSIIRGSSRCTGHSECDAILVDHGTVDAAPQLYAANPDAALIHEAAIGKIAGEQILKLRTLGLTEQEAEEKIIAGFLK